MAKSNPRITVETFSHWKSFFQEYVTDRFFLIDIACVHLENYPLEYKRNAVHDIGYKNLHDIERPHE